MAVSRAEVPPHKSRGKERRAAAIDLRFPVVYGTTFEQDSHVDVADGHAGSICITAEKIVATNTPWKYQFVGTNYALQNLIDLLITS